MDRSAEDLYNLLIKKGITTEEEYQKDIQAIQEKKNEEHMKQYD